MLIKSLKLENIRSYTNQVIDFPKGSVVLSGDIGSGKSTILAAIEFALFGIKRKDLSGNALLRHGKSTGSVELNFNVDNKDIIIKRNLKRGKNDIKQDAGYIIIDNLKKEATAVELKSKILELLGFPLDLVSKTKDLVYRYTVYTPQEQMKQILAGDVESRLDTLRRVFGIEKYKKIRENTLIILKYLKEKIDLAQGQIQDLDEKKSIVKQRKQEIKEIDEKINQILPKLNEFKQKLELKKQEISAVEKNIQEFNNLKKELGVAEANLSNDNVRIKRNEQQTDIVDKEIIKLKEEVKGKETIDAKTLGSDIIKRQKNIDSIEKQINELNKSLNLLESKKQVSEGLKQKIMKIDQCPTCLQQVSDDHKMFISSREDENIIYNDKEVNEKNSKKIKLEEEVQILKNGLEKIKKKEAEYSLIKLKLTNIEDKTKLKEQLKKEINDINIRILELQNKIKELNSKIDSLKDNEAKYNTIKKEYDELGVEERKIEIQNAELIREKETISKLLLNLEEEIEKKLKIKEEVKDFKEKHNWLDKHFVNLVSTIEKHVMLRIHQQFNELFKEWFNLLIEDEVLNAKLDDSFTPVIEQDGYDIEFTNLSGGEKTSLALAYRLSLNKVINDLITTIKMSDLIILDEPTDGFSTEQLDRVRNVIDQLNLNQVIIVSHESKIEGFVDNVIRIGKDEQVSRII